MVLTFSPDTMSTQEAVVLSAPIALMAIQRRCFKRCNLRNGAGEDE